MNIRHHRKFSVIIPLSALSDSNRTLWPGEGGGESTEPLNRMRALRNSAPSMVKQRNGQKTVPPGGVDGGGLHSLAQPINFRSLRCFAAFVVQKTAVPLWGLRMLDLIPRPNLPTYIVGLLKHN